MSHKRILELIEFDLDRLKTTKPKIYQREEKRLIAMERRLYVIRTKEDIKRDIAFRKPFERGLVRMQKRVLA